MQPIDLISLFCGALNDAGISYMVTGSVACVIYGEPRLTHDVDLVLELVANDINSLQTSFPEKEFYLPSNESLRENIALPKKGHFNIIHHESGFKADCYLKGDDTLHVWGLANRKTVEVGSINIKVAPPEYVILRKLEFFREGSSQKHLRDIAGILHSMPELLSSTDLLKHCEQRELNEQWSQAVEFLGKLA